MSIDRFTREEFEAALPVNKTTGEAMWRSLGLLAGEYSYSILVGSRMVIQIRSSVQPSGVSAGSGKDSIRCWLHEIGKPHSGSKIARFITRRPGWKIRLHNALQVLWRFGMQASKPCPACQGTRLILRVNKPGANTGRLFLSCVNSCQETFVWLTDAKKESNAKATKATKATA